MGGSSGGGGGGGKPPQIQTVPQVSPGAMIGVSAAAVPRLAGAASTANVNDRRNEAASTVSDILLTGGAGIVNPQIQTRVDAFSTQLNKQLTPLTRTADAAILQIAKLQAELANPNIKPARKAQIENKLIPEQQSKLDTANRGIERLNTSLTDFRNQQTQGQQTLTDLMAERFPEARQALERSQPFLDQMGQLGAAGERLAGALGQGYQAGGIGYNAVSATQAARQADIAAGRLGDSLMGEAMRRVDLRGRLDSEATRDAIQSARQGFAARGMATGNSALGAELLNRDRYARQRAFEDLGFAQGIQGQDLGRQFQNQATQQQREIFNAGQANQVALANAEASMRAQVANEEARRLGNQMNVGMLGDAYNLQQGVVQEGLRGAALGSQLASAANPYNQALGLYGSSGNNTGSQSIGPAAQMGQTWYQGELERLGFNANAQNYANYMQRYGSYGGMQSGGGMGQWGGAATGALSGAASGAMIGSVVPGIGTAVGAIGGALIGGAGGYFSDEDMKTDIKPLGSLTSVMKIPAYEYRYKGEKKKRRGVMAQDVAKVLPQAVSEVEHQGKKRLVIKPAVIGAALAQELKHQTKAAAI